MKTQLLPLLLLLTCSLANAQTFYVSTPIDGANPGNKSYQLSIDNCDSTRIFVCPATVDSTQYPALQFLDLAIDKQNNLYYVSGYSGNLYSRNLNDTSSCQFLGAFNTSPNALVVDSANTIYATDNSNGCHLLRYNITTGIFDILGTLPGFSSAGDLFFYEHRLFMTGTTGNLTASYLVEVDIDDPSQSCYYMGLQNLHPYAAFSVNFGTYSKAYFLSTDFLPNNNPYQSRLFEIDMVNKTIGAPICTYPFWVGGAAAYYNLTANSSTCTPPNAIPDEAGMHNSLRVFPNPFSNQLAIQLSSNVPSTFALYNALGQIILRQTFSNVTTFSTAHLAAGIYFYEISNGEGMLKTGKVVRE